MGKLLQVGLGRIELNGSSCVGCRVFLSNRADYDWVWVGFTWPVLNLG